MMHSRTSDEHQRKRAIVNDLPVKSALEPSIGCELQIKAHRASVAQIKGKRDFIAAAMALDLARD
eukprot:4189470-Pleurochrysis_carterae.AAC.1